MQCWAFGQPLANIAITAAARDRSSSGETGEEERTLLEITNLGTTSGRTNLTLDGAGLAAPGEAIALGPGAADRLILNFAFGSADCAHTGRRRASDRQPGGAGVAASHCACKSRSPRMKKLRQVKGLDHAGSRCRGSNAGGRQPPAVSDCGHESTADASAWQFELLAGPDLVAFEGPYVVDRSHPLTEGLSLDAIIWSAAEKNVPHGVPVITAGNRVLVADEEEASGKHRVQLAIDMQLSNLADSPEWPILIANLGHRGASALPGPAATNLQLGQLLRFTRADDVPSETPVLLRSPDGAETRIPVEGKVGEVRPDQVGLYEVRARHAAICFCL